MVACSVDALEEPVMRYRRYRIDFLRERLGGVLCARSVLDEPIGPSFGENCVNAALYDSVNYAARHSLWIRDNDTTEADVNDLLLFLTSIVHKLE